jgi:hypothetical protein
MRLVRLGWLAVETVVRDVATLNMLAACAAGGIPERRGAMYCGTFPDARCGQTSCPMGYWRDLVYSATTSSIVGRAFPLPLMMTIGQLSGPCPILSFHAWRIAGSSSCSNMRFSSIWQGSFFAFTFSANCRVRTPSGLSQVGPKMVTLPAGSSSSSLGNSMKPVSSRGGVVEEPILNQA